VNSERLTVNRVARRSPVPRLLFAVHVLLISAFSAVDAQIQDNSFFIEEAYNQEAGVVQHISSFARASGGGWNYGFTQEWPLGGIRHQLSYTIPVQHTGETGTGVGDVALNYRYELVGNSAARTTVAPRLSIIVPTGNDQLDRGSGGLGIQANLPLSHVLSPHWVTHWNAGLTATPSARNSLGQEATTTNFNLGASVIWLVRPSVNLLLEALWVSEASVVGSDRTVREESGLVSPGIRVALNLPGNLQIVPGMAYSVAVASSNEDIVFLYLSFEHPFKRQ
jgi:hypothetical protein